MHKFSFALLLCLGLFNYSAAQVQNYFVKKAPFSSEKFDEFSPVYYMNGIVFCTNRTTGLFSNYTTTRNKGFFRLSFIDTTGSMDWQESRPLTGEINSDLNNGPATFNSAGDTVYFSRNILVQGKFSEVASKSNKLGLFYAVLKNGEWTDVHELRFNDKLYNVTTPSLTHDGKRLFFASDKPEGYGGSDLYYSDWKDGYWNNPVNLGPLVNTRGNEAYPYVNESGELFFSSDSLPGKGGKDIFFTKFVDTAWIVPVGLNAPVNSKKDDFGFVADNTLKKGYFTSDRDNMLDIYEFRTLFPQFLYCESQTSQAPCFIFTDDASIDIDPLLLQFTWDFGDGSGAAGFITQHCYQGPGKYTVTQSITDRKKNTPVFTKMSFEVEVSNKSQPLILSEDRVVIGNKVDFRASETQVHGNELISCAWDFGDNSTARGNNVSHIYTNEGQYVVKLSADLRDNKTGHKKRICVSKQVTAGKGQGITLSMETSEQPQYLNLEEATEKGLISVKRNYSVKDELKEKAIFRVEIFSSDKRIPLNDQRFKKIIPKYFIKEAYDSLKKVFSYVIDEQLNFMSAYPAYTDAHALGYDAGIKTYIPSEPGEMELWNLKRIYGMTSDLFFMEDDSRLSSRENPILEQLVLILRRYPEMKLIIAVHTDNSGSPDNNVMLSRNQAQSIVNYLTSKGISRSRLTTEGHGGERPVAQNYPESERRKNRRVEFIRRNN
jgi:outer membrane protein OmpA-like peptidoglycan-associated protein